MFFRSFFKPWPARFVRRAPPAAGLPVLVSLALGGSFGWKPLTISPLNIPLSSIARSPVFQPPLFQLGVHQDTSLRRRSKSTAENSPHQRPGFRPGFPDGRLFSGPSSFPFSSPLCPRKRSGSPRRKAFLCFFFFGRHFLPPEPSPNLAIERV